MKNGEKRKSTVSVLYVVDDSIDDYRPNNGYIFKKIETSLTKVLLAGLLFMDGISQFKLNL